MLALNLISWHFAFLPTEMCNGERIWLEFWASCHRESDDEKELFKVSERTIEFLIDKGIKIKLEGRLCWSSLMIINRRRRKS